MDDNEQEKEKKDYYRFHPLQKSDFTIFYYFYSYHRHYLRDIQAECLTGYVGDVEKFENIENFRELLKIAREDLPNKSNLWILSAFLEICTGNFHLAQKLIQKGCKINEKDEKIWNEAVKLRPWKKSKRLVIKQALQHIPNSLKMWIEAIKLETNFELKSEIIQKAIECNPSYTNLFKSAVMMDLSNEKDLLFFLHKAVTYVTKDSDIELWLDLTASESQKNKSVIIDNGLKKHRHSEKLWLAAFQNAKLYEEKSTILAQATHCCPNSINLWLIRIDLEPRETKSVIIQQALDKNQSSVSLALEAVKSEKNHEKQLIILSKAAKFCKNSVELQLSLARLETYEMSKKRLYAALEDFPHRQVWITIAMIEEKHGNYHLIQDIIDRALITLACDGNEIIRTQWINEALNAENCGALLCGQNIIRSVMGIKGFDDYLGSHADTFKNNVECFRAVFYVILQAFPTKKIYWILALFHVSNLFNTMESVRNLLKIAIKQCPENDALHCIIHGKIEWNLDYFHSADRFFKRSIKEDSDYENLLSEASLYFDQKYKKWKNDIFRRGMNKREDEITDHLNAIINFIKDHWYQKGSGAFFMLVKALQRCPASTELWIMKGKYAIDRKRFDEAFKAYTSGIKYSNDSVPLRLLLSELEEKYGYLKNARDYLMERLTNSSDKCILLWISAINLELRAGDLENANAILSEALRKFPNSSDIWIQAIQMEKRSKRRDKIKEAIVFCGNNPNFLLTVSKMFFDEGEVNKCRKWFNKAVEADPSFGDTWACFYKFEKLWGNEKQAVDVELRCMEAYPTNGNLWCEFKNIYLNSNCTTREILGAVSKEINIPFYKAVDWDALHIKKLRFQTVKFQKRTLPKNIIQN